MDIMDKNEADIIKKNILSRELLFQIILTAIFISLGTNLIVTAINNLNNLINCIELILGIMIVLISSIILIYLNFIKYDRVVPLNGFFLYDIHENAIYNVEGYSFSKTLSDYLNSALNENESMNEIWEKDSLKEFYNISFLTLPIGKYPRTSAKEIIEELTEYIILEILSQTLSKYFQSSFLANNTRTYKRKDIPDILLENRFLNLFSMPMEERKCFKGYTDPIRNITVTRAFGKDRQMFQKFELILPKNTKIKRLKPHKIILESDYISIELNTIFTGETSHHDSFEFRKYYLGLDIVPKTYGTCGRGICGIGIQGFKVQVNIDIKFKWRSLFSITSWKYIKWLDYYVTGLNKEISADYFLESINWNQTCALMHLLEIRDNK